MNIPSHVYGAATQLRLAIENYAGGNIVGPEVLELVSSLGGNPQVVIDATTNGKPNIVSAYLITLFITSLGRPQ